MAANREALISPWTWTIVHDSTGRYRGGPVELVEQHQDGTCGVHLLDEKTGKRVGSVLVEPDPEGGGGIQTEHNARAEAARLNRD